MGIGLLKPEIIETSDFVGLSQKDWNSLRQMSDKQGVSAIVFDGLSQLVNSHGRTSICPNIDYGWWQQFILEWIGITEKTEQRNLQQLKVMEDLADKWTSGGCRVMVFKGQANAIMYPKAFYRSPGDIDCYLFENYAYGNEIARKEGAYVDEGWYKHSQIQYKSETFENHRFFVHTRDGKRGKRLEAELEEALKDSHSAFQSLSKNVIISPPQWTAMFLTYHACAHFVSEGLRLKQVLDWAMFLQKYQGEIDWDKYNAFCERNHLKKFADAITELCANYLGVKILFDNIGMHSSYTEKIIKDILYSDDYVYSSGVGVWMCRWLVVKNLFKYRWKYEEIYEESIWVQLWYYIKGCLFHTE